AGTIGYVVPFAIPEVIRHANAFALGAQAMHPGVKVKLIWTNSWFSPDKEKKAAENLHAAGADVIGQNVDSPAAGQYAESAHIPWVGYDSDAKKFAPKSWLTAAVYDWGIYYTKRVKAAIDGTWKTGFYYGSIKDGMIKLASYGPSVSAKTKAAEGEVHGLLGENGAGKSTISNILTGLYRPDAGEIFLQGRPVSFSSTRDALDAGVGMVHQHFRLVPPFTVAENVILGDHRGE